MKDRVYISTYGCQMNVNDTERMHTLLEMMNYQAVDVPEEASLIIINSCSVREKAVHKVHSEVGRYRKLKDKNPTLKIGVSGCVAQQEKNQLLKDLPVLDFVFGTDAIDQLPMIIQDLKAKSEQQLMAEQKRQEYLNQQINEGQPAEHKNKKKRKLERKLISDERPVYAKFKHSEPYQIETLVRNPGVATFVNITKGCDNFCTFCVVPFTRGRERSRNIDEIIRDVQALVGRGVKEVTLVGQNVNSYKSESQGFGDLLSRVANETEIQRIRYTTPHPKDFDRELADIMAFNNKKIMEYIHLPAQSGNSEVLKRMNRGYTREEYLAKAKMLQAVVPGAVFSTDLIVGFPGETEAQFQETLSLLDEVPFESIYAFKYSPRPFTKAAQYLDQVDEEVKTDRLTRLLAKHRAIAFDLSKKYVGKALRVLVEEFNETTGSCFGRSTQNKTIHFAGRQELIGQTVPVLIKKAYASTLHGELSSENSIERSGDLKI